MALVDCEGLAKACQTKAVQHSAIHDVRFMHNVAGCMAMVPEYSFNIILKLYMYVRLNWAKTGQHRFASLSRRNDAKSCW